MHAVRHVVVAWLLVVEPVSLALALDAALPRLAVLGLAAWFVAVARVGLTAAGIVVARRLRDDAMGAWRVVAAWSLAATATTLGTHAAPLATAYAPSERRVLTAIAVAGYLTLALAAWRVAAAADGAPRESS